MVGLVKVLVDDTLVISVAEAGDAAYMVGTVNDTLVERVVW